MCHHCIQHFHISTNDISTIERSTYPHRPQTLNHPHCAHPQFDAPVVTKAFLRHDLPMLKEHCGPELIERFSGIFKHFSDQVGLWGQERRAGEAGRREEHCGPELIKRFSGIFKHFSDLREGGSMEGDGQGKGML